MRKVVGFPILIILVIWNVVPAQAFFGPNPGDTCSTANQTKKLKGKEYVCQIDSKGKLRYLINSQPTDSDVALALVTTACTLRFGNDISVNVAPMEMLGSLWNILLNQSAIQYPTNESGKKMVDSLITRSTSISNEFESAAALDAKWVRINSLWTSGVDSSVKRWKIGGVSLVEAIQAASSNLDSITSICNVAFQRSNRAASIDRRSLGAWMDRNSKGYL